MLKKSISLLMALCMLLSVFGIAVSASANDGETAGDAPRYTVIASTSYGITISGLKAYCTGALTAQYSTSLNIKLELQKKSSGTYSTIKTWTGSKTGVAMSLEGSKTINPLSDYRLKATFKAGSETVTYYDYP